MNFSAEWLRSRREALLRESGLQRQRLRAELAPITTGIERIDRGLARVRRVATPPVLLAGGLAMALLLGRRGARRSLAAGLAVLGFVLRSRSAGQLLAGLLSRQAEGQAVSRSR